MIRQLFIKGVLGFGLLHSALLVSACSGDPATESPSSTGTFSMPLLTTAGSHSYRLQGGLYVSGPTFQSFDLGPDAQVLSTNLPTGSYYAYLYSWALSRDDGSGQFVPVSANLVSSSAPSFSIFNQTTTTVSFQFETDGQLVTIGAGQLNLTIGVHETSPVCTPLGADCPAESWCAPTELTGAALRCIPVGPVAIGEACNAPNECAANSSCFDLGGGAVCLQLCSSAEFEQPCGSTATCTPRGTDYGVCVPSLAGDGAAGDKGN